MPGLFNVYKSLVDEIDVQLKTITELATDTQGERVKKWNGARSPTVGRPEAFILASTMTSRDFTTNSSNNTFTILVDLLYYADDFETGFDICLNIAEKVYDKFHGTSINGKCRVARCEIAPGDGEISGRNLLAIPVRIIIRCEKIIIQ